MCLPILDATLIRPYRGVMPDSYAAELPAMLCIAGALSSSELCTGRSRNHDNLNEPLRPSKLRLNSCAGRRVPFHDPRIIDGV